MINYIIVSYANSPIAEYFQFRYFCSSGIYAKFPELYFPGFEFCFIDSYMSCEWLYWMAFSSIMNGIAFSQLTLKTWLWSIYPCLISLFINMHFQSFWHIEISRKMKPILQKYSFSTRMFFCLNILFCLPGISTRMFFWHGSAFFGNYYSKKGVLNFKYRIKCRDEHG